MRPARSSMQNRCLSWTLFCVSTLIPLASVGTGEAQEPAHRVRSATSGERWGTVALFPQSDEAFRTGDSWARFYQSEPIDPATSGIVAVVTEPVRIPGWEIRFRYSPPKRTAHQPFRVSALVRYTGGHKLDPELFVAVSPRVLPVPVLIHQPSALNPTPTNVVILLVDALRPDHLPEYKHPSVIAPHMSLLGALGTRFTVSYGASSSTRPSMGSLFTGLHPRAHGAVKHCNETAALHTGCEVIAEAFEDRGYETAGFWTNSQVAPAFGFARGFQTYVGPLDDREITPQAVRWLRTAREPFFLYLHYLAPHHPYEPPAALAGLYDNTTGDDEHNRYFGEITAEDMRIGGVLAELARLGMLDRTLIWLLSDHGEEFWEHGWKHHGSTLYDESLRTVSRCFYPPGVAHGQTVETPVTHVDIYPTLADIFSWPEAERGGEGGTALSGGHSLLPLLEGGKPPVWRERALFGHHNGGSEPGKHESDKQCILQKGLKLIWWPEKGQWELYDLNTDPLEKKNLLADGSVSEKPPASRVESMKRALQDKLERIDRLGETLKTQSVPMGHLTEEQIENLEAMGYGR